MLISRYILLSLAAASESAAAAAAARMARSSFVGAGLDSIRCSSSRRRRRRRLDERKDFIPDMMPSPLADANEALLRADEAFTQDWSIVTEEFAIAAEAFSRGADLTAAAADDDDDEGRKRIAALYRLISEELEDASQISGCISVGPPSSVPNLLSIRGCFRELGLDVEADLISGWINGIED